MCKEENALIPEKHQVSMVSLMVGVQIPKPAKNSQFKQ